MIRPNLACTFTVDLPVIPQRRKKTQKNKLKTQPKPMGSNILWGKMCLSVVKLNIAC